MHQSQMILRPATDSGIFSTITQGLSFSFSFTRSSHQVAGHGQRVDCPDPGQSVRSRTDLMTAGEVTVPDPRLVFLRFEPSAGTI